MCAICKAFKSGALSPEEARESLEEQSEFLTEEHIEDIEHMILVSEDSDNFLHEFRRYAYDEDEDLEERDEEDYDEYPDEDEE